VLKLAQLQAERFEILLWAEHILRHDLFLWQPS